MSFEFKYRTDRRRARNSSQEDDRRRSPSHDKDRHRQDKLRKSKWERKSRSRSRSNHRHDKYVSHDHNTYKRQQKYSAPRQTQYRSKEYDKRQNRHHEDERWRDLQKNRNQDSRKRHEEQDRRTYDKVRKDQNERIIPRKQQIDKRDKSFSARRDRSPSSHSPSISAQKHDKKQQNSFKTDENYKQNREQRDTTTKLRYIRRKDDNETFQKEQPLITQSKTESQKMQTAVDKQTTDNIPKTNTGNGFQNRKYQTNHNNNTHLVSGLKFGVKTVFPPPPKPKKPEEQFRKQPQKQFKHKQNDQKSQLFLNQQKIDKEISDLSPIKRHVQDRIDESNRLIEQPQHAQSRQQKTKISKYQLMLREAKSNLQVPPPSSSFIMLDTFKNMNKFYVETLDVRWAALLRRDLQQYDSLKQKIMHDFQADQEEETESKLWIWLKEERNEQELQLKFKLQELRQQSMSLNELVRRLRFVD